jgi:hypothetical protein
MPARNPVDRFLLAALAALTIVLYAGDRAAGQERTTSASPEASAPHVAGWLFTPMLVYSGGWDDNVLLHDQGDTTTGDFITVVNPRGALDYAGRHTQFAAHYDGAFLLYRTLNTLNSYDQRASLSVENQVTRHITIFAADNAAITPTTAAVEFFGVPFLRTGSRINQARGGVQIALAKRTSITASYTAEWVGFDDNATFGNEFLRGGQSQGVTGSIRHHLGSRLALIGDYNVQHGTVANRAGGFDVQNSEAGIEYRLSDVTKVTAAAGFARLGVSSFGPARTGPALRAGVTRQLRKAALDLGYSRSFVPSYGFGGTMQNEEATARVQLPLGRRTMAQSSLAWRSNEPLTPGDLKLVSWWFDGAIGYSLTPWLRIEGFYNGANQKIDRPGGILNRNHVGFQFVLSQPVRIQ